MKAFPVDGPPCPLCGADGQVVEHITGPNHHARPGAVSLCATCLQLAVFAPDGHGGLLLRPPNAHEEELLANDPGIQELLTTARRAQIPAMLLPAVRSHGRYLDHVREVAAAILGHRCGTCNDTGHVCENHQDRLWGPLCCPAPPGTSVCQHGACHCGAGMPCPSCTRPGGARIGDAFQPGAAR